MLRPRSAAVIAALATIAVARKAPADRGDGDALCRGMHSLWNPFPDACLDVIDTDRPHQTDTPHVVPAGHSQIESAPGTIQLGGLVGAPRGSHSAHLVLLDNIYKAGVVSDVELDVMFKHAEYVPAQQRLLPPGPLEMRAKFNLLKENGWTPAVTVVPWVFLPVATSEALRGGPLVFWGWELPTHLELEVNAGVFVSADGGPKIAPVLASALTFSAVGEFRVYAEVYATGADVALGTGALWAITGDTQVDLGTTIGLNGNEAVAAPFVGFSIRR
jgi:hypothetical protein